MYVYAMSVMYFLLPDCCSFLIKHFLFYSEVLRGEKSIAVDVLGRAQQFCAVKPSGRKYDVIYYQFPMQVKCNTRTVDAEIQGTLSDPKLLPQLSQQSVQTLDESRGFSLVALCITLTKVIFDTIIWPFYFKMQQ